jgi:hypothetical protein
MTAFGRIEQNFLVNSPGRYPDVTEPAISNFYYKPRKAQEISNLDPVAAKENPYYIPSVLASVYKHFTEVRLGKLSPAIQIPPKLMLDFDGIMQKSGMKFGITTMDPEISRRIRALKPSDFAEHKVDDLPADMRHAKGDPDLDFLSRDAGKTYYMHFFSIEDIHRMGTYLTQVPGHNGVPPIARSASWQTFYDLANPEIF